MGSELGLVEVLVQAGGIGVGLAGLGLAGYTIRGLLNHLSHMTEAQQEISTHLEVVSYTLDVIMRRIEHLGK